MSYNIDQREEKRISLLGNEQDVQAIVAKGSLWISFKYFKGFYIRVYEGYISSKIYSDVGTYSLTPAYNTDLTVNDNYIWVWMVDSSNNLKILEYEPFLNSDPILIREKTLRTGIDSVYATTKEGTLHIVTVVYSGKSEAIFYQDPFDEEITTQRISYDASYGSLVNGFINTGSSNLFFAYTKASSPYNAYYDEYTYSLVEGLTATNNTVYTATVSWDPKEASTKFILERDTNSNFSSSVEIYDGYDTSYVDTALLENRAYYYRVKAYIPYLTESGWVSTSVYIEPAGGIVRYPVIYVDSLYGSDSNSGSTVLNPLKTLYRAYKKTETNGKIVLQNGDGSSYGDLSITKNLNIQGAYGACPVVGTLTFTDAQGSVEGLKFENTDRGIVVNRTSS